MTKIFSSNSAFSLIELVLAITLNAITISVLFMLFLDNVYQNKHQQKIIIKESFANIFSFAINEIPEIQKYTVDYLYDTKKVKHHLLSTTNSTASKTALKIPVNLKATQSWLPVGPSTKNQTSIKIFINSFTLFKLRFQKDKLTRAKVLLSLCIPNDSKYISIAGKTIDTKHPNLSLAYLLQKGHYYPFFEPTTNTVSCCKPTTNNSVQCEGPTDVKFLLRTYIAGIDTKPNNQKYVSYIQELPTAYELNSVWGSGFFASYDSPTTIKIYNFYQYPVCFGGAKKCPKLGLTTKNTNYIEVSSNISLKLKSFINSTTILESPFEGAPIYLY